MGLLDFFRPKIRLAIGDCSSRSLTHAETFPVNLSGRNLDGTKSPLCRIHQLDGEFSLEPLSNEHPIKLNGQTVARETPLKPNQNYGLALDKHLMVLRLTRKPQRIGDGFSEGNWDIAPRDNPEDRETLPPSQVTPESIATHIERPEDHLAFPTYGDTCFLLSDLLSSLDPSAAPASDAPPPAPNTQHPRTSRPLLPKPPSPAPHKPEPGSQSSPCPYCWKPFTAGDALSIAVHDSLTGDPVLGSHVKLRFAAERFNSLGQALDAEGVPCPDHACPHCRGRLPPSFFSQPQHILSLVGAPSSGKSYYLSVLLRQLPEDLIRHYSANLQDGDPSGNAQLNEMKNRVFSANTPEDAFISKTDFEGVMYERLYRDGKLVPLPRPFVYYLQSLTDPECRASLVFYDNAGEHFKPGIALDESPGALHVAASAGLLFLFDPSSSPAFRKLLRRKRDPQLHTDASDEQDTILSELGVRVKKMRALESHEKVDTPLAILVGKFDLWQNLLPPETLHLSEDCPLTPEAIAQNSRHVRSLLAQLCPTIVANAESISTNVTYFPLSSLGHSPKEIPEGPLAGRLAPNPKRLKPIQATAPVLWILSQQSPSPIQRVNGAMSEATLEEASDETT
ncbi:FHA domain-containing protein [Pelagicoccus sp. SDUM812002]|uniref:FHA domain-containing protein n=1 Tax=Pelagicoccus sp. SDUM812002 TaxID=3041266 RepID=UPI00280EB981|nr:FHA domain-containing protein [Pelagicoccus sp. SDUM812002]MDQ8184662.1 FHA domain-containing protein [Pelagicoccus sp. SDUM812002]